MTVETALPDFYKMTLTGMTVTYPNYKHFSNKPVMFDVKNSIYYSNDF